MWYIEDILIIKKCEYDKAVIDCNNFQWLFYQSKNAKPKNRNCEKRSYMLNGVEIHWFSKCQFQFLFIFHFICCKSASIHFFFCSNHLLIKFNARKIQNLLFKWNDCKTAYENVSASKNWSKFESQLNSPQNGSNWIRKWMKTCSDLPFHGIINCK